jgi:AcrR family transcriptional regulator
MSGEHPGPARGRGQQDGTPRADARRNRAQLIDAAHQVFAESGPDASLDEIARRAGVGNATLYRHFPTRIALLEAVHREQIDAICALSERLASDDDAGDALERWLGEVIAATSLSRGLSAAITAATTDDPASESALRECREAIFAAGDRLLEPAQRAGRAPRDASIGQLLRFVSAIAATTASSPDPEPAARELLAIVVAGLRARASGHPDPSGEPRAVASRGR